jgi:DNA-binding transcriptional regulator YhcF (GntR family)
MQVSIDPGAAVAPYEQLRSQVAAQVADGRLPAGNRLPTVRQLATDLGLAANTVARAYRELEADGVVVTRGRAGTFVTSDVVADDTATALAEEYVADARRRGLTLPEATRLVELAWNR